jgi:dephospho-CoA kinase
MRIIGLTGGIASGKSSVAEMLKKLGAVIIDADTLAREVVEPGEPAYHAIVAAFGARILNPDMTINRGALAKLVFDDPVARRRLEIITHPAIGTRAEEQLAALAKAGNDVVFYMAPLLIEAGVSSRVDELWVVYVDQDTQLRRLMERDGSTREEALRRIAAQMPIEEKKNFGKIVIVNSGTPEETERQVKEIWEREFGTTATNQG